MNTLLNGNIHEVQEWLEASLDVPWDELIQDERAGKKRKGLIKWLKGKAKAVRDTSTPPEFDSEGKDPTQVNRDLQGEA